MYVRTCAAKCSVVDIAIASETRSRTTLFGDRYRLLIVSTGAFFLSVSRILHLQIPVEHRETVGQGVTLSRSFVEQTIIL